MHIKFILPILVEAKGRHWRSIKYSLFPPLGLATLAGYLRDDSAEIVDEHVESLGTDDRPDLVAIETYVTSAKRCYAIADHYRAQGVYVVLGGLHVTSLPREGLAHADTVVVGPASVLSRRQYPGIGPLCQAVVPRDEDDAASLAGSLDRGLRSGRRTGGVGCRRGQESARPDIYADAVDLSPGRSAAGALPDRT